MLREPSSLFFAPMPTNDRDLIVLQIARDLDTLKQDSDFIAPDREFYESRIAAMKKLATDTKG